FIKSAKALGFTLTEIAHILDEAKHGNSPCPLVREIIVYHIEENKRKIQELKLLQRKMEKSLNDWSNMEDSMPNGESVCHLIESVAEIEK
ncbi:MAG: MerR family DNA-binding protein, partial [Pyrinomonadaceae bacterium]